MILADDGAPWYGDDAYTAAVHPSGRYAAEVDGFWRNCHNRSLIVTTLRNLVLLFARTGRDEAAVALAATLQLQAAGKTYGTEAERIATALAAVHQRLGEAAYARAWSVGEARTLEEAADAAVGQLDFFVDDEGSGPVPSGVPSDFPSDAP
jgi:hypothetical protein